MCRTAYGDAVRLRMRYGGKQYEPVGTCTHLSRLKGGGFAIKASGSEFAVAAERLTPGVVSNRRGADSAWRQGPQFEPALAALSTPCLCQLGYATVVWIGGLAP